MNREVVKVQIRGKIATLIINRPDVMNALNMDVINGLNEAFDKFSNDENVHVLILEGTGGNFSSGADMLLIHEERSCSEWLEVMKAFGRLIKTIRRVPKPVITKVRGVAVGGGCNLALAGDFVLASHNARFCEVFVNIGAILDGGGTYFLPRLVGIAKARELALLGDIIDGKTAASIGLIYKSVPDEDLDNEVDSLAERLLGKSPMAMALIKEGLEGSIDMTLEEVLEWEASHQAIMLQTKVLKDAVKDFLKSRGKKI
jgi:2-(1,2-epoxy-1,2-dihydrophenyl)acetyl-CoA isomerase